MFMNICSYVNKTCFEVNVNEHVHMLIKHIRFCGIQLKQCSEGTKMYCHWTSVPCPFSPPTRHCILIACLLGNYYCPLNSINIKARNFSPLCIILRPSYRLLTCSLQLWNCLAVFCYCLYISRSLLSFYCPSI